MEQVCDSGCLQRALDVIGDKWTPRIVREMASSPQTFSSLEESLRIGPRTLSQRIKKLQDDKIIVKNRYCEKPQRFEYLLTKKGTELVSILDAMANWGAKHPS